jgi:hypothetical protein
MEKATGPVVFCSRYLHKKEAREARDKLLDELDNPQQW